MSHFRNFWRGSLTWSCIRVLKGLTLEIKFLDNYRNNKEMKKVIKEKDHKKTTLVYFRNFEAGMTKLTTSVLGPHLVSLCQVYVFFSEEVFSILGTIFSFLLVKLIIGQN